ncbi:hypothetical protein [Amycolatopsis sp. GA6-003]|uniref:hypothetical protein n=1 Tax=Amycolatopsis sp. GA6-003 TaxID=2652444 RepID=UPI0039174C96
MRGVLACPAKNAADEWERDTPFDLRSVGPGESVRLKLGSAELRPRDGAGVEHRERRQRAGADQILCPASRVRREQGRAQQWSGRKGNRVNALAPGCFQSEMTAEVPSEGLAEFIRSTSPLARRGEQHELDAAMLSSARPRPATSPARRSRSTAGCPCADRGQVRLLWTYVPSGRRPNSNTSHDGPDWTFDVAGYARTSELGMARPVSARAVQIDNDGGIRGPFSR